MVLGSSPRRPTSPRGAKRTAVVVYGATLAVALVVGPAIARLAPEILVIDEWLVAALEAGRRSGLRTVAMGTTLHNPLAVLPPLLAANEAATLMLKFGYGAFDTAAPMRH